MVRRRAAPSRTMWPVAILRDAASRLLQQQRRSRCAGMRTAEAQSQTSEASPSDALHASMRANTSFGEETMKLRIAATLLALALSAGAAAAQPAKGLKEQIVGTWNFVVAE